MEKEEREQEGEKMVEYRQRKIDGDLEGDQETKKYVDRNRIGNKKRYILKEQRKRK